MSMWSLWRAESRPARVVAIASSLVMLLGACAPAAPAAPTVPVPTSASVTTAAKPAAPAPTAQATQAVLSSAGTLVLFESYLFKTGDPGRQAEFGDLATALYDTLLTFQGDDLSKPVARVATGFTISSDARIVTLPLRKDVKFSDGSPLAAADVVFSFNRLKNLKGANSFLLDGVTVTAPDPGTVVLTCDKPCPLLPFDLPFYPLSIVNSAVVKANGGTDAADADKNDTADKYLNEHSAGSGSYVLDSIDATTGVVLKVNPNYWGPKPAFGTVAIRKADASTQVLEVQKSPNTIVKDLSSDQAGSLQGKDQVTVSRTLSQNLFYLYATVNPSVGSSGNLHVQNAIRLGLDYGGILRLAGPGAIPAAGMVPTALIGALPANEAPKRDLTRAKQELASSGVSDPTLTLEFLTDVTPNGISMATLAQKIKADLAEVGITVNLSGGPVSTLFANFEKGKQQMGIWWRIFKYPDPGELSIYVPGGLKGEQAGMTSSYNPVFGPLVEQATGTADTSKLASTYQGIQRELNKNGPWFPLFQPAGAIAYSSNLSGVAISPLNLVNVAAVGSK